MDSKTNSLNWFEIPVKDMKRTGKFYETIFGIKMPVHEMGDVTAAMFPMEPGTGKANGSLAKCRMHRPAKSGTVIYLNANPDLKKALGKVAKAGGKVVMPKTSIGPNGFMAFFLYTEGNRAGLHSMK